SSMTTGGIPLNLVRPPSSLKHSEAVAAARDFDLAPFCVGPAERPAPLVGDLAARAQDVAHGTEFGVPSNGVGDPGIAVTIGYLDQFFGLRDAALRYRSGDGRCVGAGGAIARHVLGQAGIARGECSIDSRLQATVAWGGVSACTGTERQDEQDNGNSHRKTRFKLGGRRQSPA